MKLQLDPMLILYFILGIIVLYLSGRLLLAPFKLLLKLGFSSVLGAAAIVLINLIGQLFHFSIPLNPLNAVLTGVFGLPGVLLIFLIRLIFI